MNDNLFQVPNGQPFLGVADADTTRTFLARVFSYMAVAMVISGVTAWVFAHTPALLSYLINPELHKMTAIGWVVLLAPLGLIMVMRGMMDRLSGPAMLGLFVLYSALTGATLSFIFLANTNASIARIFLGTTGLFAVMATLGYTTKTDLTKLGSILFIGLIGIVIAGVINMFMHSDRMSYILSMLSVVIFTGLTAYKVQNLKNMAGYVVNGTEVAQKMALMGALSLYISFLNLFLSLLRLFGNRRS